MDETLVVVVRSLISFFTLLLYTRLLGQQQLSSLTYFDYINGITIGSLAGTLATDLDTKGWAHFVGLTIFVLLTLLLQYVSIKARKFSRMVDGKPVLVIDQGKILEENLARLRMTKEGLLMLLRNKNVFDISRVQTAILESQGDLTVLLKSEYQPLTPKDIGLTPPPSRLSTEVVLDGKILEDNLKSRGRNRDWLMKELKKQKISDLKEVSFAVILPNDQLYVDKYRDNQLPPEDQREGR